jgi:RNA polymerase sigma-70 factor, ECF subfamily
MWQRPGATRLRPETLFYSEMGTASTGVSLAERIQAGDAAAEDELIRTYSRGVFIIVRARTRDPEAARDLTQQVLLEALKALRSGRLREVDKMAAFLQGIARNVIANYVRVRVRRSECALDAAELEAKDPVEAQEAAERKRLVQREIGLLNALDQRILLLSLVDGHPLAEVATRLKMSPDAVRKRKSRAIKKLKSKIGMSHE